MSNTNSATLNAAQRRALATHGWVDMGDGWSIIRTELGRYEVRLRLGGMGYCASSIADALRYIARRNRAARARVAR